MLAGNFQFLSVPSKSIHPVYQLNTTGLIRKGYFKNKEGRFKNRHCQTLIVLRQKQGRRLLGYNMATSMKCDWGYSPTSLLTLYNFREALLNQSWQGSAWKIYSLWRQYGSFFLLVLWALRFFSIPLQAFGKAYYDFRRNRAVMSSLCKTELSTTNKNKNKNKDKKVRK